MSKKLYSIFYNDGDYDQHEVVASDHKPTEEEAKQYIKKHVNGLDESDDDNWTDIYGIYTFTYTDIQTGDYGKEIEL